MHWTALPRTDQIFTHIDPDTGVETVFAVDRIRYVCEGFGDQLLHNAPIQGDVATMITKRRGIEPPRLRRALKTRPWRPLLYLELPDDTVLLADGSHTYVAMWMKGQTTASVYLVPQHIWSSYTVEGLPPAGSEDELINSYSGIKP
jgi:hypothetical protein